MTNKAALNNTFFSNTELFLSDTWYIDSCLFFLFCIPRLEKLIIYIIIFINYPYSYNGVYAYLSLFS